MRQSKQIALHRKFGFLKTRKRFPISIYYHFGLGLWLKAGFERVQKPRVFPDQMLSYLELLVKILNYMQRIEIRAVYLPLTTIGS